MEGKITIDVGEFTLRKPVAGTRNKAMIKAEKNGTGGEPSKTTFISELLPHCIMSHPFGDRKLREALDSLDFTEYDKLTKHLSKLMTPITKEVQKE